MKYLQLGSSCLSMRVVIQSTSFDPPYFSPCSPSGWDNEKKIAILHENFTSLRPDDPFEDVIAKPPIRKVGRVTDMKSHAQPYLRILNSCFSFIFTFCFFPLTVFFFPPYFFVASPLRSCSLFVSSLSVSAPCVCAVGA